MNKSLNHLTTISRRIGERFDLVQTGDGNTSLKDTDGSLYIKASGVRLSDIPSDNHYAKIDNF